MTLKIATYLAEQSDKDFLSDTKVLVEDLKCSSETLRELAESRAMRLADELFARANANYRERFPGGVLSKLRQDFDDTLQLIGTYGRSDSKVLAGLHALHARLSLFQNNKHFKAFQRIARYSTARHVDFDLLRSSISNVLSQSRASSKVRTDSQFQEMLLDIKSSAWRNGALLGRTLSPDTTIVVPVYAGLCETLACLSSVVNASYTASAKLVVVDDLGPDERLRSMLVTLASAGFIDLLRNEVNRGFVSSVNRGMLHAGGDVVLLNSDTLVGGNWLDGLRAGASELSAVGSVSPLTNNATILSYPRMNVPNIIASDVSLDEMIDIAAARSLQSDRFVEVPTTVGFCMYIPMTALTAVGLFDEGSFGTGYGEESDWAMRARLNGLRHYVATDVFVFHQGSVSFSESARAREDVAGKIINGRYPFYWGLVGEFVNADPLREARRDLDVARLARMSKQGAILHLSHNLGGGTEKFLDDLQARLNEVGIESIVGTPENSHLKISSSIGEYPNLNFNFRGERDAIKSFILQANIKAIHLHHILGFDPAFIEFLEQIDIPLVVTLHDYIYICPQFTLLDFKGKYCEVAQTSVCNICIEKKVPHFRVTSTAEWRYRWGNLLSRALVVHSPSEATKLLYRKVWPQLEIDVVPHLSPCVSSASKDMTPITSRARTRVLLIGAIGYHKGAHQIEACVADADRRDLAIEFHLIGGGLQGIKSTRFVQTGAYHPDDLPTLISAAQCTLGFIPAIWPETFSYVLSEMYANNIYPIAFDIGAQAERIKANGGSTIALGTNASHINDILMSPRELGIRIVGDDRRTDKYLMKIYGPQIIAS